MPGLRSRRTLAVKGAGAVIADMQAEGQAVAAEVGFPSQRHEHFVQVPGRSWLATSAFGAKRKARTELVAPAPDRFVADDDAAFKQKLLDVAQA